MVSKMKSWFIDVIINCLLLCTVIKADCVVNDLVDSDSNLPNIFVMRCQANNGSVASDQGLVNEIEAQSHCEDRGATLYTFDPIAANVNMTEYKTGVLSTLGYEYFNQSWALFMGKTTNPNVTKLVANCTAMSAFMIDESFSQFETKLVASNQSILIKTAVPLTTYDLNSPLCEAPTHSEFICYMPPIEPLPEGPKIELDYVTFALYSLLIFFYLLFAGYISSFCANKEFHRRDYWIVIIMLIIQAFAFFIQAITAFRQAFHDHTGLEIEKLESMAKTVQITINFQTHTIIMFVAAMEWYVCYKHLKTSKITMELNDVIIQENYNIEDDNTPTVNLEINIQQAIQRQKNQRKSMESINYDQINSVSASPRVLKFTNLNNISARASESRQSNTKSDHYSKVKNQWLVPNNNNSNKNNNAVQHTNHAALSNSHTHSVSKSNISHDHNSDEENQLANYNDILNDPRASLARRIVKAKDEHKSVDIEMKTKPQTLKTTVFNTQNDATSTGATVVTLIVGLVISTMGFEYLRPSLSFKQNTYVSIIIWLVLLSILSIVGFGKSTVLITKLQSKIDTFNLTFPVITNRLKKMAQISIGLYVFQNILIFVIIFFQQKGARKVDTEIEYQTSHPNFDYLRVACACEFIQKILLLVPVLAMTRIMSDITVFKYFVSKMDRRQAKKLRNKKRRFRKFIKSKRLKKYNSIIDKLNSQAKTKHEEWEQLLYNNYKSKVEALQAIKVLAKKREQEKEKRNLIINNQLYDIDRSDDEDSEFEYVDDTDD